MQFEGYSIDLGLGISKLFTLGLKVNLDSANQELELSTLFLSEQLNNKNYISSLPPLKQLDDSYSQKLVELEHEITMIDDSIRAP